jgi:hypothetical protein
MTWPKVKRIGPPIVTLIVALIVLCRARGSSGNATVDEVHYTCLSPTSVAFDWRTDATDIRYGTTNNYTNSVTATTPNPLPFSSAGPSRKRCSPGSTPGTTYRYPIGGGRNDTSRLIRCLRILGLRLYQQRRLLLWLPKDT